MKILLYEMISFCLLRFHPSQLSCATFCQFFVVLKILIYFGPFERSLSISVDFKEFKIKFINYSKKWNIIVFKIKTKLSHLNILKKKLEKIEKVWKIKKI